MGLTFIALGCATMYNPMITQPESWICYYGKIPRGASLKSIDLAILDPDNVPNVHKYTREGTMCVGYVSIGEAEDYRFYWKKIKNEGFIIAENADWKGNYYIDPRNERWKSVIIDEVIPRVLNCGYHGIFMDTLDTAEYLEWLDPDKYEGSIDAMVELVRDIRRRYPTIIMISNNGYPLLSRIAQYIDAALVEDLYTAYDFATGVYGLQDTNITKENRQILHDISARYRVPILTLDYVHPDDSTTKLSIERKSKDNGFFPYIADINLEVLPRQVKQEGNR
jgi:uncharacterized protein (TIGR01370 family)